MTALDQRPAPDAGPTDQDAAPDGRAARGLGRGLWPALATPGTLWLVALFAVPFYAIARLIPATRAGAQRLGLVTHAQMLSGLVAAVESPVSGIRIVEVPEIARGLDVPMRGGTTAR